MDRRRPPHWKEDKNALVECTNALLLLLLGQKRETDFTLIAAILFQYIWRERNNAIYAGAKEPSYRIYQVYILKDIWNVNAWSTSSTL